MIERFEQSARMSQAVAAGGFVFLAGQVAPDPTPSVSAQAEQILARIDALLEAAGSDRTHLVSVSVWLADIGQFKAFNAVWDKWVASGHAPARATVEARLATPAYLVEIAAIALKRSS